MNMVYPFNGVRQGPDTFSKVQVRVLPSTFLEHTYMVHQTTNHYYVSS